MLLQNFLTPRHPIRNSFGTIRRTAAIALAWLTASGSWSPDASAQVPGALPEFRSDRILVKPKAGVDLAALHRVVGAEVFRSFPEMENLQVLRLASGVGVDAAIAAYTASGFVAYAERDYVMRLQATPSDFRYLNGDLWNLHNTGLYGGTPDADIDAPEAWDAQSSAANIIVAVIDTGIRLTHEDLAPNLWVNPGESGPGILGLDRRSNLWDDDSDGYVDDVHGVNTVTDTGLPADDHGHGTHVSGTIGARGNNGVGVVGVAWQVQLMACKAFDTAGNGALSDLITCIDYARAKGAHVINASWGHAMFNSNALSDAIARVRQAGILFVAAAGNWSSNNDLAPIYPANFTHDNIITVAATDRLDQLAWFSNFGRSVHLAAPGSPIFSCWIGSDVDYRSYDGTSMAVPHVVGACALVWARNPALTYDQVKARVLKNVDRLPALKEKTLTGGRLNVRKALAR